MTSSPVVAPARATSPLGDAFHVFDTTLRDGAQREGISYSVADKSAAVAPPGGGLKGSRCDSGAVPPL